MWQKSREIKQIFQLVPLLFSLQLHFMSLKSGRSQLVLAIIWVAQLVFLLPISFWFYVCMPSFILIFHMSVELWFGDLWERVDCPTMARRYWSLCEYHQLWSLLRILGRKDNYWDQARAGGKYGAGTDHGKSPQMQTGPEERRAGAVAKIQWGAGSQQRCCLARALAVKQSWFWLFHGLKQSVLLAPICLWSGLVLIMGKWIPKDSPQFIIIPCSLAMPGFQYWCSWKSLSSAQCLESERLSRATLHRNVHNEV